MSQNSTEVTKALIVVLLKNFIIRSRIEPALNLSLKRLILCLKKRRKILRPIWLLLPDNS